MPNDTPIVNNSVVSRNNKSLKITRLATQATPRTKAKKPTKAEVYSGVAGAINGTDTLLAKPRFNLTAVEVSGGVCAPVEIMADGKCVNVSLEKVARYIMDYTQTALANNRDYTLTAKECRAAADTWLMKTLPVRAPALVLFKSQPGICYHRNNFDLSTDKCPSFDELFSRMSNAKAVKAWIWSLFEPRSYREQYVWLYGKGGGGKSKLLEFIVSVLGDENCLTQSCPPGSDKHWAVPFVGKRLVLFPDFENDKSLNTSEMKSLTGGDKIAVRPFNSPGYDHKWQGKLIFASNHMPNIPADDANLRRNIFCEVTKSDTDAPFFIDKLKSEAGAFLNSCKQSYEELCPNHGKIPCDEESVQAVTNWASIDYERYEDWFIKNIEVGDNHSVSAGDLATHLHEHFKGKYRDIRQCYEVLKRKGYNSMVVSTDGVKTRVYRGIKIQTCHQLQR